MPDSGKSPETGHHRLPAERGAARLLRSPLGLLFARPWFDRCALWLLRRWFFPLSRLWAAARLAEGSPDRFYEAVPLAPREREREKLMRALVRFESSRAAVNALEAEWARIFFGPDDHPADYRVAVESARRDRRNGYNSKRRHFRFLLRRGAEIPLVRRAVPAPEAVAEVYDPLLADPARAFAPPDPMPTIEVSRTVPGDTATHYWLRFPSPSARTGDTVYARVQEPEEAVDPPTLLFGHGVCVEYDHWHGLIDEVETLVEMGFRVVRPEAPWHGRRVLPGEYGGEHFIGTSPFGPLDLFTAGLREWSVLMDWCRRNTSGPVAMGGTSLGALMSQLAADRARDWPERLQPDALLLITHCGKHEDAVLRGRLGKIWGIRAEAERLGWTEAKLHEYLSLLDPDPARAPVVPPEKIVSVLGSRDTVTPFDSGLALLDAWGVPAENCFVWRRGHFSVPLTLMRDKRPLERFRKIVAGVRTR